MKITDPMGELPSMAQELGVSEQSTRGAAALIPALLGGFKKQANGALLGQLGAR